MSAVTNTIVELNAELQKELELVRKKRNFVPKAWIEQKTTMFNQYMKSSGLKACVVNLSGGVDSGECG